MPIPQALAARADPTGAPPSRPAGASETPFPAGSVDLSRFASTSTLRRSLEEFLRVHRLPMPYELGSRYVPAPDRRFPFIPKEDLKALWVYTRPEHEAMNRALRGRDPKELARWAPVIKCACAALNRLPSFEGTVYRVAQLGARALRAYAPGRGVTERGFMSTSLGDAVLGVWRPGENNALFVVNARRRGHDIRAISSAPWEREVVFTPGTRFRVLTQVARDDGQVTIYLDEVP